MIEPITHDERLVQTLVRFFASDLDRARTARDLDVSRRGFHGRLDRIARLTGLDPRTTRGVQLLGAALTAGSLERGVPSCEGGVEVPHQAAGEPGATAAGGRHGPEAPVAACASMRDDHSPRRRRSSPRTAPAGAGR